jgi:single-stranded-DNA-specific exonuclease
VRAPDGARGLDLRGALASCRDLVERFGGHREAAGVTVRADRIDALREAFAAAIAAQHAEAPAHDDVELVDAVLPLRRVDEDLVQGLVRLSPYGVGFPGPRFCLEAAEVARVRVLKARHLSLTLAQGEHRRDAIAFSQAFHALQVGDRIGCVFVPVLDRWAGRIRLRLDIERLWRAGSSPSF